MNLGQKYNAIMFMPLVNLIFNEHGLLYTSNSKYDALIWANPKLSEFNAPPPTA